jgi:hypothetical protein
VLACTGLVACSSPPPPAFNPGGPASTAPATPMATSSGPGSVIMPPFGKNAHVIMTDWMPKDAGMAKAALADKDYELAFLYAEYTGGKSQDWTAYVNHTMELQVRAVPAKPDVTTESFKGTIKIFDMKVIRDPPSQGTWTSRPASTTRGPSTRACPQGRSCRASRRRTTTTTASPTSWPSPRLASGR